MQAEAVPHDISPTSRHSSPPILAPYFSGWHLQFFIRTDLVGNFHTYPPLGGPFRSLQEAEDAIASHLDDLRSPVIRRKRYDIAFTGLMAQGRNLPKTIRNLGISAYWFKLYWTSTMKITIFLGILHMNLMVLCASKNFIWAKGADDLHGGINNMFFAEVARIKGENVEYVLNCFCMVKRNDNGRCYGCTSYGNVDLKHPVNTDKYKGRHSRSHKVLYGLVDSWEPAYIQNEENECLDDRPIPAKSDGAKMSAVLAKREDAGLAKREAASSTKRDDGQGSRKYIVPARRQLV